METSAKDFWNKRFGLTEYIYGEEPNEYLKLRLAHLEPGKILFPADGEGRNGVYAASLGWDVTSFDPSEEGKKKAEDLAKRHNTRITYTISDVENIRFPENSFDALALIYAHFHSSKRRAYHRKLSAFLKPGGTLILEAFSKNQVENQKKNPQAGGPKDIEMLYDPEEVASDFQGFSFFESVATVTTLKEGNYHIGKGNVVRMFAKKLIYNPSYFILC